MVLYYMYNKWISLEKDDGLYREDIVQITDQIDT